MFHNSNKSVGRPKTSLVWKYFIATDVTNSFQCNLCKSKLTSANGSTGSLRRHLKMKHGKIYAAIEIEENILTQSPRKSLKEKSMLLANESLGAACALEKEMNQGNTPDDSSLEMPSSNSGYLQNDSRLQITHVEQSTSAYYLMEPISAEKDCKKERPKTSLVWKYFIATDVTNSFQCNLCKSKLTVANGSTGSLRRHIQMKHGKIYEAIEKQEKIFSQGPKKSLKEKAMLLANESLGAACALEKEMNQGNTPDDSSLEMPSSNSGYLQNDSRLQITHVEPSTSAYYLMEPISAEKGKELDKQLLKIIVKHLHPFSIIENPEFISFVITLNPNYTLPSYKMLSDDLLLHVYHSTIEKIKSSLKDTQAIALTTDRWTTINEQDIITVTAHFLTNKLELKSSMLDCICYTQKYNSSNVSLFLHNVAVNWKISNKIVAVVTDNSECMMEAVKDCKWVHIPCFGHTLNKAAKRSLENIEHVLVKVRNIVEFLKLNLDAMAMLCAHLNKDGLASQKLKTDFSMRWNSTFDMLTRFIKNKLSLLSIIEDMQLDSIKISSSDWIILEKAVKLLIPWNGVMTELCSEKNVPLSKVPHMTRFMIKHVKNIMEENLPPEIINMGRTLNAELNEYLKNIEANDVISQSVLLDARLKKRGFQETSVQNAYLSLQKEIVSLKTDKITKSSCISSQSETQNFTKQSEYFIDMWSEFRENNTQAELNLTPAAAVEIDVYLSEPYESMKDSHLQYWAETLNQNKFPTLFELVNKRFCIPVTSVPAENLFSKAGKALLEKRTLLISDKVKEILFLHNNL